MATTISSSVKPRPPGAGHEVYPYAVKQMPLVRGGSSSDPGATGTTAAAGSEHFALLELTVGARDRADGDSQVASELAQRGKPVAEAEPACRDQVCELAPQLADRDQSQN